MEYVNTHYKGPRMVLAAAGGVNHDELHKLAEKNFGNMNSAYDGGVPDLPSARFTGSEVYFLKSTHYVCSFYEILSHYTY